MGALCRYLKLNQSGCRKNSVGTGFLSDLSDDETKALLKNVWTECGRFGLLTGSCCGKS